MISILEEKKRNAPGLEDSKIGEVLGYENTFKVKEAYSDPKKLSDDLVTATGDEDKASSMLAFAANTEDEDDIFDEALKYLSKNDYNE